MVLFGVCQSEASEDLSAKCETNPFVSESCVSRVPITWGRGMLSTVEAADAPALEQVLREAAIPAAIIGRASAPKPTLPS